MLTEGIKCSRNTTPGDQTGPCLPPGPEGVDSPPDPPGSSFPPATAPSQGVQGTLCVSCCLTTFISLPSFKMPNAATRPGGSDSVSYPECQRRNSLQTPLTDRLLPASTGAPGVKDKGTHLGLSAPSAFFGIKITRCHFHILKETRKIMASRRSVTRTYPRYKIVRTR